MLFKAQLDVPNKEPLNEPVKSPLNDPVNDPVLNEELKFKNEDDNNPTLELLAKILVSNEELEV